MRKIKHKIVLGVMVVVTLCLLIGLGVTYQYIHGMLKNQIISDNQIKLSQTARMLEYMEEDSLKLGYAIVADEDIIGFIRSQGYESVEEEVNTVHSIVTRLQQYISMREYVQSIALVRSDGSVLWDKAPFDQYFADTLKQSWYTDGNHTENRFYFTDSHPLSSLYGSEEAVVSLIAPVVNQNHPQEDSGQVIINIRLQWFIEHIKEDASYFDDFSWLNAKGTALYWPQGRIPNRMTQAMAQNPGYTGTENLVPIEGGFMIQESLAGKDWILSAFVSESFISDKIKHIPILFMITGLLCLVVSIAFLEPIVRKITKPIGQLTELMDQAGRGNLNVQSKIQTNDEMEILGEGFNKMMNQLNEYLVLQVENEKQIREQEYDLILARLNPHFTYNTLNTLVYLAKRDGNEDCAAVASSLIFLLQDVIQISDRSVQATLEHELETVRHYARIQEYRYPGKFKLEIETPQPLKTAVIPKTMLQPLVENALIHGIFPTGRFGVIKVATELLDDRTLHIEVSDNGVGVNQENLELAIEQRRQKNDSARHIGLNSIVERIRFMYGNSYGITFHSEPGKGTRISVKIPYQK